MIGTPTDPFAERVGAPLSARRAITTLQLNVGLVCNLACRHCHVESSPKRTGAHENLSPETAERVLAWLAANPGIEKLDLTGGSPEMNPSFRRLVSGATGLGLRVMDRCNPTILTHRGADGGEPYSWAPSFFAEHGVHVVASLPCYLEENVRRQRGTHAYDDSIEGLRRLNEVGYGVDPALRLTLVYNPTGPSLPPPQAALETDYRRELRDRFDLEFTELWTLTNMPIARWREELARRGRLDAYESLLRESFNPATVEGLMCRGQVHVDSQGWLSDCDFNYALGLRGVGFDRRRLWDVTLDELRERPIRTAGHCFGCTAGSGSSCGGAIT
ncbi:MAG: arsenosugar biosynthesis radical SAM (seleno)protein ArsS [Planctomycetota bacterium]